MMIIIGKQVLYDQKKTGYQGGLFRLLINIPIDYPNGRPEIHFKYPVFHPNIQI